MLQNLGVSCEKSLRSARTPNLSAVDLTESFVKELPRNILNRYDILEVRMATRVLSALNSTEFKNILAVLGALVLEKDDVLGAGKNKSRVAQRLDTAFRKQGWREVRHDIVISSIRTVQPYPRARRRTPARGLGPLIVNEGYKVDNFKNRVALDVEWHAKDGNLDRDLAAYRALYDAGIIDVGVIITRGHESLRSLALSMDPATKKFKTTTTTSIEKLEPRLTRGDSGGCPVVAFAITSECRPMRWHEHGIEAKALGFLISRSLGICACCSGTCGMHSLPPTVTDAGDSTWNLHICEAALRAAGTARCRKAVRKWARKMVMASTVKEFDPTEPAPPDEENRKTALEMAKLVREWLPEEVKKLLNEDDR